MSSTAAPNRLPVSVRRPQDFDEYWAGVMDELATVPLAPSLEHLPHRSTDVVDVFELRYTSLDHLKVAAWYCAPKADYAPPPYPGLILSPGYISEPVVPKSLAKQGYAALSLAPRGKLRSNTAFNPGYPGLLVRDIVDRGTYGYRGFYADACRAMDFLVGRPEVDASRIGVHGSSQGGALSLVLAALRKASVVCCAVGAPFLCGIWDATRLTHSYPYEEISEFLRAHPDLGPQVENTVAYYDVINFAPMIRCPTLVHLGLADDVCPPETGLALFASLSCPKQLLTMEGAAHDAGAHFFAGNVREFLAEHLKPVGVG
ncbi:MAG TPA: acetylxylan esterase [Acidimicrobiales bacterium]|nr:acetylxylan esterase [Acidimicrobiales bacterium]